MIPSFFAQDVSLHEFIVTGFETPLCQDSSRL